MACTLAGRNAIRTVELGLVLAGGRGFFRKTGMEQRCRDVQESPLPPASGAGLAPILWPDGVRGRHRRLKPAS